MEGYQKMENEHVAKLQQAKQLIEEVLGGEKMEAEKPDPKAEMYGKMHEAMK